MDRIDIPHDSTKSLRELMALSVAELDKKPNATTVRAFCCTAQDIYGFIEAIANRPHMTPVTEVRIEQCYVDPNTAAALLNQLGPSLETVVICLETTAIGDGQLFVDALCKMPNLHTLMLNQVKFSGSAAVCLGASISSLLALRRVEVFASMDDAEATVFVGAIREAPAIEVLRLEHFGDTATAKMLAIAVRTSPTLRECFISSQRIEKDGMDALFDAFENSTSVTDMTSVEVPGGRFDILTGQRKGAEPVF